MGEHSKLAILVTTPLVITVTVKYMCRFPVRSNSDILGLFSTRLAKLITFDSTNVCEVGGPVKMDFKNKMVQNVMSSFREDSRTWQNFGVITWKCQLSLKSIRGMFSTEGYRLSVKPLGYTPCKLPFGIFLLSACALSLCLRKVHSKAVGLFEVSDYLELGLLYPVSIKVSSGLFGSSQAPRGIFLQSKV